jgi:hypothetical protein
MQGRDSGGIEKRNERDRGEIYQLLTGPAIIDPFLKRLKKVEAIYEVQ